MATYSNAIYTIDGGIKLEILDFINILLSVCGGISIIGGAIVMMYKGYKAYRKPSDDNSKKLAEHDKDIADLKTHVESDYQSIKKMKDMQSSMGLALVKIMDHLLYGDHTEELEKAKNELLESIAKSK